MELVVDFRESLILENLKEKGIPFSQENLTVGDLLLKTEEKPVLLIERKTVRDLMASLRDGRYHNQRQRWKEFLQTYPGARVALWVEGDLVGCHEDETIKASLVNSLLRLQAIHGILVYQVRNNHQFIESLQMVRQKCEKDPSQLTQQKDTGIPSTPLDLKPFKKTGELSPEIVWQGILSLIPGVSKQMATKITQVFPTLKSLVLDPEAGSKLKEIKINNRKISTKTIENILRLLCA